ncbi:N-6 DNA methylase [Aureispira anguillae]|uniref:site-specific DNA-methyltransferase (adenine-specific) n=1 Tax=Aureispira anguillae TaxID=2864201 RepID=A0A915YEL6_9BACT|nr:N-6 DNA methylase [Aureispira anguillae]BDS11699.1 N-6 DNA methylase [Aureispira anguillae]
MEIKEEAQQLETVFFATLDSLRGIWNANNASSVLLSLVFFKRILALKDEQKIDAIETKASDYQWASNFRNTVVDDPEQAMRQLIGTLVSFSKRNKILKNIFAPLVLALEEEQNVQLLIQAILMLERLDFSTKAISVNSFGAFFNDSLYRTALRAGKIGVKRTTPKTINSLLIELAAPKDGDTIYDPTAGQGSTLIALLNKLPNIDIIAQEQNIHVWALCKMNLLANGAYHAHITNGNTLTENPSQLIKADIAIAHFPFGQYISTEIVKQKAYTSIPFDVKTPHIPSNSLFIQLMLSKLNQEGKMITIIPIQTLVNDKEDRKLREFLIRRDLIEAVITLPYGLLHTTGIPICILVINKKKRASRKEHILFINGANLAVKTQSKLYRELTPKHIECISEAFHHLTTNCTSELDSCVSHVPLHHVILNNYNLDAKRYASPFIAQLKQLDDYGQLIRLKEIFKSERPALWFDETPHQDIPYIRPQNLGTSITNYLINTQNITTTNKVKQVAGQLINESILLVNRSGKKLKTSYFTFDKTPILVNEDIMTFRIDENKVLIEYLLLQLHDSLFIQQLNMYKTDYQHKMISEEQFEELQIRLPALEEQAQIIKETKIRLLQEEEQKVEQLRNDLNLGKQRAQNEQYKIISSLQHELGNRLPAVLTEIKNLKDYLKDKEEEGSPILFSEPIFPLFEEEDLDSVDNLGTVIERIESILVHSINSLDSTGDIIKADRSKLNLESTKIKDLLEEIQQIYRQENIFTIQIEVEEDEKGKERPIYTKLDKTQITTVITNLIDNAKRHGFVEKNKKYTIQFRIGLSSDQQEVILIYKNDGKSFPNNFSFEDFIGYGNYAGQTGHSGIGGYLIHQIIDNHNGNINYRKKIDHRDPFKVQFEITLPVL